MSRDAIRAISLAVLAAAMVLLAPPARAGTTGKLAGRVTNEKKELLAGVNIRIEGLHLGVATDELGNYAIIGIPAGAHTVRADLLGHAPYVAENVQIAPDFTRILDITMRTQAIQLGEVTVEAERPLLQKDATGTTRFISSQEIQALPTRGYRDAAAQQTGVVNFQRNIDNEAQNQNTLIVRGGRPNETAYYLDGFSQQDPLTGTSSTAISNNAIEEVVLLTGGFAAEYGRVMSGALNVITREGGSKYSGAFESVSDVLAGNWIGAPKTDYNIYDASLGGPLIPGRDDVTFYFSGSRTWQRDRSPSFLPSAMESHLSSLGLGKGILPANSSAGWTYQGKTAWQMNDHMNLKLGGVGSQTDWRQYLNTYLLDLEHSPRYQDKNYSYFGSFNHSLSTKAYYSAGLSYFQTERKRGDGLLFDDLSAYYRDPNPRFPITLPMFWSEGHVWDDYLQRKSSYIGGQASYTSQVTPHHQIRAGGDFQRHTLRLFNHFFPVQLGGYLDKANLRDWDGYGYDLVPITVKGLAGRDSMVGVRLVENGNGAKDGPKHPKTWALFTQDKFEREGVIVNGGLRFDYINVDTPALLSEHFPLGNPDAVGNIPDSLEAKDLVYGEVFVQ